MVYDIGIIGAGVIGCFLARDLAKYRLKVAVFEKNNDVGNEASGANSAIIHSGYDPLPHTNKAKYNVLGNQMYDQICKDLDVPFQRIGSLTLAVQPSDIETLQMLHQRAKENHVETQLLSQEEVLKLEPNLSKQVLGGLYAPSAGIIDPFNLCVHLMENAIDHHVQLFLNTPIQEIEKKEDRFVLNQKYQVKILINCAGVHADEINHLLGIDSVSIIPRKGEYLVLDHFQSDWIRHTLFLVPSDQGKGVLISPTTSQNYLIGPSASVCLKEDKDTDKPTLQEIKKTAAKMVADIPFSQTIRTFAGVRPTPKNHDFIIEETTVSNFIQVVGIESPGLTAAPAISKMVIETILSKKIPLHLKKTYRPTIKKYLKIQELSFAKRNQWIKKNPNYGEIVCKCEKITKGEILDCLSRSCPPHSIKGLKKRLRVGFGKCQGGMCQPLALKLLAEKKHCQPNQIPYDSLKSWILDDPLGGKENENR